MRAPEEHRPLRIAFVAYRGNMQCGGQGIYLWFLARELARLGHEVEVFVGPPYPDPMPFAERVSRLPNEQFWGKWFLKDKAQFVLRPDPLRIFTPTNFYELAASRLGFLPEPFAFSVRALRAFARRVREGARFDIVHDVQCLGYGLLGIRALGAPVLTTVHHPLTVDRRLSFLRDETLTDRVGTAQFYPVGMQAFVARHLDRVLTSSETSAKQIQADFGVARERLVNVGNGLDTELFSPDPAVPRKPRQLLCVGRAADPTKGIRTLIEAFSQLPSDVELVLVDREQSEARKWAEQAGCGERLTITGRVENDELVQLYRSSTLVISPSRHEGFGLPAAEAMACGTPVVATAAGALAEVMKTGGGGIVVPVGDAEAVAKAASTLLSQPEACERLGAESRPRIVDAYAWPRVAARTAEVYRATLALRARRQAASTTAGSRA